MIQAALLQHAAVAQQTEAAMQTTHAAVAHRPAAQPAPSRIDTKSQPLGGKLVALAGTDVAVLPTCSTPPLMSHRRVVMTACESATNRRVLLAAIAQQLTLPENPPDCRARRFASLPASWSAGVRQACRELGSCLACSSLSMLWCHHLQQSNGACRRMQGATAFQAMLFTAAGLAAPPVMCQSAEGAEGTRTAH